MIEFIDSYNIQETVRQIAPGIFLVIAISFLIPFLKCVFSKRQPTEEND